MVILGGETVIWKIYQFTSYLLKPKIFLSLISVPPVSVSGEELDDAWNAFRNGWSMAITGESKNSADGAPEDKNVKNEN